MLNKALKMIKQEKIILIKSVILILLFFGINIYFSMATDTYVTLDVGFKAASGDMLFRNGRPIIALIYWVYSLLGVPSEYFYYISSALALIFLVLAIVIMQKVMGHYYISENRRIVLSFILIANIFIIEYFMFIEKCGFLLGILFCTVGVYCIARYFRENNKIFYVFAFLCAVFAIFSYQGTISLFALLSLPLAYKHAEGLKQYIIRVIQIAMVYGVAIVLGMLAFKFLFTSTRIAESPNYLENIKETLLELWGLKSYTFNILPAHLFEVVLMIVVVAEIFLVALGKNKFLRFLHVIVLFSASCILPVATLIQGSGWMAMRIVYPFASIIGVLAFDFYLNNELNISDNKRMILVLDKVIICSLMVLMLAQYFSFNQIFIDKYKLNISDQNRANYIGQAINDYQEETGIVIKNIAFYSDSNIEYPFYPDIYIGGDMLVSAFYTNWSDIRVVNYYLKTDFERAEQNEQYREYFSGKDWKALSNQQLIFDNDTLHLCQY